MRHGTAPFWLAVRSSRTLVVAIAIVGVGSFVSTNQVWPGVYLWQNRTSAWISSLTIVIPLVSALAAWDGTAIRSANLRWQWRHSRDGGVRAVVLLLAANVSVGVLVFAAIGIVTHLPIGVAGVPPGGPVWIWALCGAVAVMAASAVGILIGLAVPYFLTVVLTPVAVYVACAFVFLQGSLTSTGRAMLSPTFQQIVEPFYALNVGLFAAQALWLTALLLLGCSLCLVVVVRDTSWPPVVAAGTTIVAVITGGLLAQRTDQPTVLVQAHPFVCEGEKPLLCLTADYEPVRDSVEQALTTLSRRVSGTPFSFEKVELRPRGVLGSASRGAVSLHMDDQADGWQQRDSLELLQGALDPSSPASICSDTPGVQPDRSYSNATAVVLAWASGDGSLLLGDPSLEKGRDRLAALTPKTRSAFLHDNLDRLCAGTLRVGDIP